MARKIELFRDTQPDDAYADVARREAYAKALQEMAARQRGPAPGGRVQAQYGIGEGLTQLAEALLARRAGRQAIETRNAADANTRVQNEGVINDLTMDQRPQKIDAQGQPIAGTEPQQMLDIDTGRPELSARGQALSRAVAGQDPQQIRQFLMQQQLSRLLPDPSQVADRDLKRMQIEGGLRDRADARQQRMLELGMRLDASAGTEAERAALRRELASGQQQTQRDIAGMRVDAQSERKNSAAASKDAVAAEKRNGRVASLQAALGALSRVQETSNTLGGGGGFIEGRIPAIGSVAQDFDGAKAQLLATIQSALRVPGIGSQSNLELQSLMAALPERTQEREVRDNQIKGIADRINIIMEREGAGTTPPDANAGDATLTPQEQAELAELRNRLGK